METQKRKNVVIFGGASGIGLATAHLLCDQGARVTVADVKEPAETLNGRASWIRCDVRDQRQVEDAVQSATQDSPLDWLVYSTGIQRYGSVVSTSVEEYDLVQQINARGAFLASRAAIPRMRNGG